MESLPADCLASILIHCDYDDVFRLKRTSKLFQVASVAIADAAWSKFAASWGGDDILRKGFPFGRNSRAHIYSTLRDRKFLNIEPIPDYSDPEQAAYADPTEDEDGFPKYRAVIYNRTVVSNGYVSCYALYYKEPIAPVGTEPSLDAIRTVLAESSESRAPDNYSKEFLDGLRVSAWHDNMEKYLEGLAACGGSYGQRISAEQARPHFIRALRLILDKPEEDTSEQELLKFAEQCTWFWIATDVIHREGPRSFARIDYDEFFGAVLPDNRKIIYFETGDVI